MQGSDYGGRVLLGDNTDRGAVMVRPIRLQGVRGRISTGLFFMCMFIQLTVCMYVCMYACMYVCMHKSDLCKIRLMANNLERSCCVTRGVSIV